MLNKRLQVNDENRYGSLIDSSLKSNTWNEISIKLQNNCVWQYSWKKSNSYSIETKISRTTLNFQNKNKQRRNVVLFVNYCNGCVLCVSTTMGLPALSVLSPSHCVHIPYAKVTEHWIWWRCSEKEIWFGIGNYSSKDLKNIWLGNVDCLSYLGSQQF